MDRTCSGAGGGGAYCSAMTVVDVIRCGLTAEVGAGGENSFLQTLVQPSVTFQADIRAFLVQHHCKGFWRAVGKGGMASPVAGHRYAYSLGRRGWQDDLLHVQQLCHQPPGLRAVVADTRVAKQVAGRVSLSERNGYPGQDATASDSGLDAGAVWQRW